MAITDIKNAASIAKLAAIVKSLPKSMATSTIKIFTIRDHKERLTYLTTLPEDTLKYLLKASTYLLLASGVILKESAHEVYLTPEVKGFLDKVREEVNKAGEVTKETVSKAVDIALGTVSVIAVVGVISLVAFLMLNPVVGGALASAGLLVMLFGDIILFNPNKQKERVGDNL